MKIQKLTILAALFPAAVWAQTAEPAALDAQNFQPATGEGFFGVSRAKLLPSLTAELGAFFSYAEDPLVIIDEDTREVLARVVDAQPTLGLMGAIGLFSRAELGIIIPVAIAQSGDDRSQIDGGTTVSGSALGDVRLIGKFRLLGDPLAAEGTFLSVTSELKLPTGNEDELFGGASASGLIALAAEWRNGPLGIGAILGPRFQRPVAFQNLVVGNRLDFGAGASYTLTDTVSLLGEMAGALSLEPEDQSALPLETRLGARLSLKKGFSIPLGAGIGLTDGIGVPTFRLFAGIEFTPEPGGDPDNDGVRGKEDMCPREPEDYDGFEDEDGCPEVDDAPQITSVDTDGDGLPDDADQCPQDPEDRDGFQEEDGCPDLDNDEDGVPDEKDVCRDQPGIPETEGCPDADGDHLADALDQCPTEAEDYDEFEDEDGCPEIDNDGDGFVDESDPCANQPEDNIGVKEGCPEGKRVKITGTVFLTEKVFFDTGKDVLQKRSYATLDGVVQFLKEHPEITKLEIAGHTDEIGEEVANLKLSERRANRVAEYFISQGIDPSRLVPKGYGESMPLDPGTTRAAREKNRRVEFVILEQKTD